MKTWNPVMSRLPSPSPTLTIALRQSAERKSQAAGAKSSILQLHRAKIRQDMPTNQAQGLSLINQVWRRSATLYPAPKSHRLVKPLRNALKPHFHAQPTPCPFPPLPPLPHPAAP